MRKIIFLLMLPLGLAAQTQTMNYSISKTYRIPVSQSIANPYSAEAAVRITYYDGLGRPIQHIDQRNSGMGTNMVTHIGYDDFGRQDKKFLPYSSDYTNLNFVASAESETLNYPNYSEQSPFSQEFYEHSPLNRLRKLGMPGAAWTGDENNDEDHTVKYEYDLNEPNSVLSFSISSGGELGCNGYRTAGTLYKTIIKNENWSVASNTNQTSVEYRDELNHILLKRTFEGVIPHDTYNVYNLQGQLAFVLSPEASKSIIAVPVTIPYNFTQNFSIYDLMIKDNGDPISGGGSWNVNIQNNTFKLTFNGNWGGPAHINLANTYELNASHPVPDMFVGYFQVNYGGNYQYDVNIINNHIVFSDHTPNDPPANFNGFIQQNLQQPVDPSLFSTETVNTFPVDMDVINGLGYQYKYDSRNRQIKKKLPGKQWEYTVYDILDRVVATGPVNSPFGTTGTGWLVNKYDILGRVAYTGYWEGSVTDVTRQHFSDHIGSTINVSRSINGVVDTMTAGYTNDVYPNAIKLLTINYYDDYAFPNAPLLPVQVENQSVTTVTKGLQTGSWTRILYAVTSQKAELGYTFYDSKSRAIRRYTRRTDTDGYSQTDTNYDFRGKPNYTITRQKRVSTGDELQVREDFSYTGQERLLSDIHTINNGTPELLAFNEYDELGRLAVKSIGGHDLTGSNAYQNVDYKYNIRGWLKSINDPDNDLGNDLFALKINYDETEDVDGAYTGTALYNGNISETYWKTASDNIERKYGYFYDGLNRMEAAVYQKKIDDYTTIVTNSYNEKVTYDFNGNINKLFRNGFVDSDNGLTLDIDDLTYTYFNKSNRLRTVDDATHCQDGFKDNFNNTGSDYAYDSNGNMVRDNNKSIDNIAYNHLNLPTDIHYTSGSTINYLYNAEGEKLRKTVRTSGGTNTIDYCDGFQYKNQHLEFFPHAEGYVNVTDKEGFNYIYNYKDQLGNVRLSYTWEDAENSLKILEENHFYPFGLKHENYNAGKYTFKRLAGGFAVIIEPTDRPEYQYKFQGQERQDELGLNWDSFKWRNYDFAIGRFMNIDPLAEDYTYNSPYAFAENKVGMGRELEGCEIGPFFAFDPPMLGSAELIRVGSDIGAKGADAAKTSEVTTKVSQLSENATRGRRVEAEQLTKNGLVKNTKTFETIDPKTGEIVRTTPDAIDGKTGGTVEVKNTVKQSMTKQLRAEQAVSESAGAAPRLIINQGAKLSKPLLKSNFKISTYGLTAPVIESTSTPKPRLPLRPAPKTVKPRDESLNWT